MEALFLYFLKANGLLVLFFGAYYMLLRKETFFNSNRWYLLMGLFTAVLLPWLTFTKTIYVEASTENTIRFQTLATQTVQNSTAIDWVFLVAVLYVVICGLLFLKITINFISVIRLLSRKKRTKKEAISVVNLTENIAPFSFFNYIAINPNLYTTEELESILLHEQVHSSEKHSVDILLANLFSVLFWFNPVVWWYKKAIIQNLEYIADQKAVQKCSNKTSYQKVLLRVVTNQNYLSMTNHFNQSLIKKRIVMLNTKQSNNRNQLKYLWLLPLLSCFIFLFQIDVVAQVKVIPKAANQVANVMKIQKIITKNTSDAEMKAEKEVFKKDFDTDVTFSKVKRNGNGEITAIKVELKAKKSGQSETYQVSGTNPITSFVIAASNEKNGLVSVGVEKLEKMRMSGKNQKNKRTAVPRLQGRFVKPELLEETIPTPPTPYQKDKRVHVNQDNEGKIATTIIINGKVLVDTVEVIGLVGSREKYYYRWNTDNEEEAARLKKQSREALAKARLEMRQIRPKMEREILLQERKKAMESRFEANRSLENSKEEIVMARLELEKARIELEKARAELEKAKLNNE